MKDTSEPVRELVEQYQMVVEAYNLSNEPYTRMTSSSQTTYPTNEEIRTYLEEACVKLRWGLKRLHVKKSYILRPVASLE